ncbi:hypothetical protein HF313_11065 [Massilia atriviolacea]|uniref:DUF4129 domain-containing protein n=1 Tax=Massilia atriviolacea TaxID=2495579 RepID=A0A430HIG8_9BURK|nr:hypothetical protein [Massilia atriviolacea]RSZ57289.1 hypothetical protein EJB06_19185 [Massilia atriviolacea]
MQIDKLQIELRPRTNAQALDLGFSLLHSHASAAYMAFLALWLPLLALCAALTVWLPALGWTWILLAWWFKPLLERAPLYVLSRQVFGTAVTWQEAVRAWPRQIGGGALRLLTWGRPFSAGRGLSHPVWMLEGARGRVATLRRRTLGNGGTASSAVWFGVVCSHLEVVLQIGILGFIGIFASSGKSSNPFSMFINTSGAAEPTMAVALLTLGAFGIATAIMAPVYTACCFTLYLNRRASMEAWDIEIKLRQMKRPAARTRAAPVLSALLALAGAGVLLAAASLPLPAVAAAPAAVAGAQPKCEPPADGPRQPERGPLLSPGQAGVRKQIDQLYATDDLRNYECKLAWRQKKTDKEEKKKKDEDPDIDLPSASLGLAADVFKVLVIALAIGLVGWLLYRYRHHFPTFERGAKQRVATEIGGLNIRAESLPPDVTAEVRAFWARGEQRAALALLYRATLSRLVTEDALPLRQGNTEGDCLRLARQAEQRGQLARGRLDVADSATTLWLNGAYAARWPGDDALLACCAAWDAQFGKVREVTP